MKRERLIVRCLLASMLVLGFAVNEIVGQDEVNVTNVPDVAAQDDSGTEGLIESDAETEGSTNGSDNSTDTNPTPDSSSSGVGSMNETNGASPTQATTGPTMPPTSEDGCYTSLDAIYIVISDDDKLFQQKRFVLCPGTVVDVGFLVPGVGIDKGQSPIIPRSNTEFLCGEDGSPDNNCLIRGGDFGVIAVPVFFRQDLSINNVLIKGFTFVGQVQYIAFLASPGDITFEDCVFKDSANFGPFVMHYDSTVELGDRRLEKDQESDRWHAVIDYVQKYREGTHARRQPDAGFDDKSLSDTDGRALQRTILEVMIRNCIFTNLQQIERKLGVEFGILSVKGPDHKLVMEDCTFAKNQFGNQELTPIGYGVLVQKAELQMKRVCFIDNDFRGSGVVVLEQTENPMAPGADFIVANYATEYDSDVSCPFLAYFETDEDRRNSNFTCLPVQTDECGGEPIDFTQDIPDVPVASSSKAMPSLSVPYQMTLLGIASLCLVFFPSA